MCAVPHLVRLTYSFRIEKSVSQRLSWALSHPEGAFFFSWGCVLFLTEEHRRTEHTKVHKDSGPSPFPSPEGKGSNHRDTHVRWMLAAFCLLIGIYDSWNALCSLYAEGLLWARNVRQKAQWTLCALWEKKLRRLREKTPQQLAWVLSYREDAFYFSQKNTEEQNTQHSTETLSQPISQNLTPTFSYNVLWILYAGGVLWVRNVGWKVLLNLWVLWEKKTFTKYASSLIGVTSHTTPLPTGEGPGEGPAGFAGESTRFGDETSWFWGWGRCDFYKRRNCPAFLSCYFFVAKQRSS